MGSDIVVSSALVFVGDISIVAGRDGFVLSLRSPVADADVLRGVSGVFASAAQ